MTQAILLVGGQGTRLRPLTISTPKPMLPVAGYPCTEHQIARAREAGITHIVLGTSYRAEVFEEYFADRPDIGVELTYAVEAEPLGTGGAIRHAAEYLAGDPDDPIVVFNGDILTGLDIAALVQRWRQAQADVAIYLTRVADPRAYGLVPTDADGNVQAFTEKPQFDHEIVTDQINAGCYVFKRSVIDQIPLGRVVSVERETFPGLLAAGARVIGVVDDGYWLDLGTPLAFARGSADLVQGTAPSPLLAGRTSQVLAGEGTSISHAATVDGGSYLAEGVAVGAGAVVTGSVVYRNAVIAPGAVVVDSIVGAGSIVGNGTVLREAVVADAVRIGAGNELLSGTRVFPGVSVADGAIRFSSDR